jgi:hypothetical protein
VPAVLIRGCALPAAATPARALLRSPEEDLFP